MSRINCHSAFKHYEMFHSGHCGGGYNNVSNTVFNINCGGHGGFWNGFGLGLGNAFGSLFSGFLGGGMGFGIPMFGSGFSIGRPMFGGGWGDWGSRRSDRSSEKETIKEVVKDDPDCAKIADITGEIKELGKNPTKDEINKIIKNIDDAIEDLDNNNKTAQKRTLENLKRQLENKLNNITPEPDPEPSVVDPANPTPDSQPPVVPTKGKVKINGEEVDPKSITLDDLITANDDELGKITKKQAFLILGNLGYIKGSGNNAVGHLSNVYAVLKLLEKSGVTVEVENRKESDDKWIKGPLSNVTKGTDGKLSYNVNCANIGAFGATYNFQAQDANNTKYKVTSTDTSVKVDNTIEVEYQGEKKPLINKSGRVLAKLAQ